MDKVKIEEILKQQKLSKMQAALLSNISPADFYQALNGKKPFFPKWRKKLAKTLKVTEEELFPEYQGGEKNE
jgi:predicted transcriptional regulator